MNKMNLANRITIARILLIPFFIASIFYYKPETQFLRFLPAIIFGLSMTTDAVDGFIARVLKQKTQLGTILDPIADKLLLSTAFICLSMVNNLPPFFRLPPWVTIIVISRDIIIILGCVIIHHLKGAIDIRPTVLGKVTTFSQMITIISVLLHFHYSYVAWNVAVVFTILSGIEYVMIGSKMMNDREK
ncbi:MAG: CDP-diacylglycerol--glycerol-3-phosphate 3-phosphatidyltransferase [Candidatus Omnitrophica bacterium CG07_land_8_20_14_0_80_42_15]|uniref:CDP-diacylglycerol--glycerol-3-phosphate 3-phosphatidyltransferase n=1 Tax=Candidatus Aquitaenariimonas noxiae TaxID=1974741 RepID=A0A2J0KYE7_9BACT|nr:MAG: CDP-diacylglycerol--glycerol-3-phosphate 3-phosphatidyltransferase [Candidatus Omnitrophica bacterium CG07_land_8_20_14_0_80_42_15]